MTDAIRQESLSIQALAPTRLFASEQDDSGLGRYESSKVYWRFTMNRR